MTINMKNKWWYNKFNFEWNNTKKLSDDVRQGVIRDLFIDMENEVRTETIKEIKEKVEGMVITSEKYRKSFNLDSGGSDINLMDTHNLPIRNTFVGYNRAITDILKEIEKV